MRAYCEQLANCAIRLAFHKIKRPKAPTGNTILTKSLLDTFFRDHPGGYHGSPSSAGLLWLFEVARMLVRSDHVARCIVNANHCISTQGLDRRSGQRLRPTWRAEFAVVMTTSIPLHAAGSESGSFRSACAALAPNPIRSEWFEFGRSVMRTAWLC
jgi:hypothetical protein